MALKARLYLAFIIMILLVCSIGAISLYAFRAANGNVEVSRVRVDFVDKELVPANALWTRISGDVAGAVQHYTEYVQTFSSETYRIGTEHLSAVDASIAEFESLLAKVDPSHLTQSRNRLAEVRKLTGAIRKLGEDLNRNILKMEELEATVVTDNGDLSDMNDTLYNYAFEQLEQLLEAKDNDPGEVTRRTERLALRSSLFDAATYAIRDYWRAKGVRGEAAKEYFASSTSHLQTIIDTVAPHTNPETEPDAEDRRQYGELGLFAATMRGHVLEIEAVSAALLALNKEIAENADRITAMVEEVSKKVAADVLASTAGINSDMRAINTTVEMALRVQVIVVVVALLVGLVIAYVITRGIVNPINGAIVSLARGEQLIKEVSERISGASRSLADGSTAQASALEQSSSALEEMASMTRMNADNATRTNGLTQGTAKVVSEGSRAMRDMAEAMKEINEKTDKVSHIIKTIEDIAFQTNLLALNAAVEAARAGEAGKGFAVVADEVRNLSQRSAQAARDTTSLIQSTVESVKNGDHLTRLLSGSFTEIESGIANVTGLIDQIAKASAEQAQGVDQVNSAVAEMDKVTQKNAEDSQGTADASVALMDQIDELHVTIAKLDSLIHGSAAPAGQGNGRNRQVPPAAGRPRLRRPEPARRSLPAPAEPSGKAEQRVMRPEEVIPLDEDSGF